MLIGLTFCHLLSAQDTVYTTSGVLYDIKIRDNQVDFVEYRPISEEFDKQNIFLSKQYVNTIKRHGGFIEDVVHDSANAFHSVFSYVDSNGNKFTEDINYNPASSFPIDTSIKLKRFKKDEYYTRKYGDYNHFYINDPARKFSTCKAVTFIGVNFSFMKLVNYHDKIKASIVRNKYLSTVAIKINTNPGLIAYRDAFLRGKHLLIETKASGASYKLLDPMSWIAANEYDLPVGKIPAIIRSLDCPGLEGVGVVFVIEKFSKPEKAVSGYWVAFDFSTRSVLLIDYINFKKVELQINNFMNGWVGYWEAGALNAGVLLPLSFQEYLRLESKGKFELTEQ
ncbi:MAG TPA: hypothetical protein VK154_19305 [Chitinophagales bacterium]|nr:hypothetical protein [Chitinophagales bacterium]